LLLCTVILSAAAVPLAAAQAPVTNADIQRLQDGINDASRDITQLRARDSALATQLSTELDDVRDETAYLKVKLRRNESASRSDYGDLRARIDSIRARARGVSSGASSSSTGSTSSGGSPTIADRRPAPRTATANEIPVGTEFDVRLQTMLSSATA